MKRRDLLFIISIVAVVGIFIFLSVIGKNAQQMKTRPEHAAFTRASPDETPNQACLVCHAPNLASDSSDHSIKPMPPTHPKKGRPPDQFSCYRCHALPDRTRAMLGARPEESLLTWLSPQER